MSNQRQLIRQEVRSRRELIVGTVVTNPVQRVFDLISPVWVATVNISSNRLLFDVPVKANGSGSRAYARRGAVVLLRRNAQGRFEVVGAGDRDAAIQKVRTYSFGNPTALTETDVGFQSVARDFSYYATIAGGTPNGTLWGDGSTDFPLIHVIDATGAVVG